MPLLSHRIRYVVLAMILTWMGLALLTRPAHGAWGVDPVQVHSTTALCPAVAATDDGHYGAIIAWQENTPSGGTIKAQHVLANGDLDPAWTTPVLLSGQSAGRIAVGAVSDASGGAYVWWMQDANLFLTHVTGSGAIASGWSANGRSLGSMPSYLHRPVALADGSGGVYVGWLSLLMPFGSNSTYVRAVHLGATGLGAGGWPTGGTPLTSPVDEDIPVNSFALDRAADGGLWLTWVTVPKGLVALVPNQPGEIRALHLTPAGHPATGWVDGGVLVTPYDTEFMAHVAGIMLFQPGALVGVARDTQGGAFVVSTQGAWDGSQVTFHSTLRHLDAVGATSPGWTDQGVPLADILGDMGAFMDASSSVRAFPDQRGGVFTGVPQFGSEGFAQVSFGRRSPAGDALPGGVMADQLGMEFAPRGDGGMFIAAFKPTGAQSIYDTDAYIAVTQSDPGEGFFESKLSYSATRYGDIGLTATGDGGAIFAWSQLIDRQGIYAIRLSRAGAVTGVPPTTVIGAPSLRVRFVRGEGVHAVATFSGARHVSFALHDLAGRRVSSLTSDATLGADQVLPGTRELTGGVYFATASDGSRLLHSKVVVIR